jgi:ABC-type lipoprotein export system ATPase subunit
MGLNLPKNLIKTGSGFIPRDFKKGSIISVMGELRSGKSTILLIH